jgi:hypothetical protein
MFKWEHIMNSKPTKKRLFRRENDWVALIDEWRKSDKRAKDFCQEKRIASSGFYSWRKRLHPDLATKLIKPKSPTNLFVPVVLNAPEKNMKGVVLTYPNGCQLQLSGTIDLAVLKILNQAMGVQAC